MKTNTTAFGLRFGRVSLEEQEYANKKYKTGYYAHSLGVVVVVFAEDDYLQIMTTKNWERISPICSGIENMTDRKIGNQCRKFLIELSK